MTPPTSLLDRVRLRLRSRRALEGDRAAAEARALGWRRAANRWRDELDLVGSILCEHGYHAHEGYGVLASDVRGALGAVAARERGKTYRLDEAIEGARRVLRGAGYEVTDETKIGEDIDRVLVELIDQRDAAQRELDQVRDELRATGHPIGTRGLSYDVDAAIDRERSRAQDLVERLADVLGWDEHRACWPFSAPHLVREVAVRLGRPMPRRRPRPSDWGGSRLSRALACTCRGEHLHGPTSIVDPRCPEHSPSYRFGGRAVQPLALPPSTPAAPGSRYGLDALDVWDGAVPPGGWLCDVCRLPVESEPCRQHQPNAYAEMLAEDVGRDPCGDRCPEISSAHDGVPTPICDRPRGHRPPHRCDDGTEWAAMATSPWCSADLDGARCSRPVGHTEPCRPVEPAPVGLPAATEATAICNSPAPAAVVAESGPPPPRCDLGRGHDGPHRSGVWEWLRPAPADLGPLMTFGGTASFHFDPRRGY